MQARTIYKILILLLHITKGLIITFINSDNKNQSIRNNNIQKWSIQLIAILNINIQINVKKETQRDGNQMIVSNHISWFDIFGINTILPARFIAKSDIEKWPIINKLCKGAGTFFIDRNRIKDTKRVSKLIVDALIAGETMAYFPEGTTTDGKNIKPFKTSLMQSVIVSGGTIQPVYLNYTHNNKHCTNAAYIDDMSIFESIWQILKSNNIIMHIEFLDEINANNFTRDEIYTRVVESMQEAHDAFKHQYIDKPSLTALDKSPNHTV